eukprot:CAMPEP_0197259340 /NCGR_PEP_ID=MMETSP1429-20130617/83469_1 /TAXON_ID=49237 /ORGANISM="Chaetoceros  sp., Strain UNC1202" /LENGTH=125 /DNA_ID=CAMNT_0042723545 /DNA_START=53 /DNA_END=430 /DNA_ORIENTATION=+
MNRFLILALILVKVSVEVAGDNPMTDREIRKQTDASHSFLRGANADATLDFDSNEEEVESAEEVVPSSDFNEEEVESTEEVVPSSDSSEEVATAEEEIQGESEGDIAATEEVETENFEPLSPREM